MATDVDQVWTWLDEVPDPEIPVISIVDLGIVRHVEWRGGECLITITPTYSGCPAMRVIEQSIRETLQQHGIRTVHVSTSLVPAWTTDWMSDKGKANLKAYGIAPPAVKSVDLSQLHRKPGSESEQIGCPLCGAVNVTCISPFGSTSCKALYRCLSCSETFDYFKSH